MDAYITKLGNAVINGELTFKEAEARLYPPYTDYPDRMIMLDVCAELHKVVRDHAISVAPVYVCYLLDMIDKIFELTKLNEEKKDEIIADLREQLESEQSSPS